MPKAILERLERFRGSLKIKNRGDYESHVQILGSPGLKLTSVRRFELLGVPLTAQFVQDSLRTA